MYKVVNDQTTKCSHNCVVVI